MLGRPLRILWTWFLLCLLITSGLESGRTAVSAGSNYGVIMGGAVSSAPSTARDSQYRLPSR